MSIPESSFTLSLVLVDGAGDQSTRAEVFCTRYAIDRKLHARASHKDPVRSSFVYRSQIRRKAFSDLSSQAFKGSDCGSMIRA